MSHAEPPPPRRSDAPAARLFLALWPPPELARALGQRVNEVLGTSRALRLVRSNELHLTLLFLGDVERAALPALERELAVGLAGLPAPRLRLAEASCFPARGRPRVWWWGLAGDLPRLAALHAASARAAVRAGWPPPAEHAAQPFRPHLTVARTRERAAPPGSLEEAFRALKFEQAWTPVEAVLVESRLASGPERYLVRRRLPLLDAAGPRDGGSPGASPARA